MAVSHCSLFKVTLAPGTSSEQVLLNYDDWMENEPSFTTGKIIRTVQYLRGDDIKTIDQGNRSNNIKFSRVIDHNSHAEAREYVIDHNIDAQNYPSNTTVRIDVKGSSFYRIIEDANLTFAPAKYGKGVHNSKPRTIYDYTIAGGKMRKVAI